MKQEIKSVLKKTVKIAGVTCFAAGSIAVLTSGVALKAIGEGGKYLAETVKRILEEKDGTVEGDVVAPEDVVPEAAAPAEEAAEPSREEAPAEPADNL